MVHSLASLLGPLGSTVNGTGEEAFGPPRQKLGPPKFAAYVKRIRTRGPVLRQLREADAPTQPRPRTFASWQFQQARGRATEATKNLQFKVAPFSSVGRVVRNSLAWRRA